MLQQAMGMMQVGSIPTAFSNGGVPGGYTATETEVAPLSGSIPGVSTKFVQDQRNLIKDCMKQVDKLNTCCYKSCTRRLHKE
jgi:hypothetical protein